MISLTFQLILLDSNGIEMKANASQISLLRKRHQRSQSRVSGAISLNNISDSAQICPNAKSVNKRFGL